MRCLAPWFVVAALAAQEPVPPPPPSPPSPPPPTVDPAVVRAGEALLRAHGERCRDVAVLVAGYTQTRTTPLAKQPLRSRGRFVFVREPACVLFRAEEPRTSIVRLRGSVYEVFRPERRRLERFHLDGPELAEGLFAVLGGDTERLLRDFAVVQCRPEPGVEAGGSADAGGEARAEGERDADRTANGAGAPHEGAEPRQRIVLAPRRAEVCERVRELGVVLRADGALAAVAYRDAAGDLVEIALHDLEPDPEPPPSVELDVPPDTKVVEHRPPPRAR